MKKFLKTPQSFFFLLSIFTLIVGFIKKGNFIDLNYFMTFLKIDVWSLSVVSSVFYLLIGINYFSLILSGKKPRKILTIIHIVLQIVSIIPFFYIMITTNSSLSPESVTFNNIILAVSFVVFILSLVIHLINFFASIFKQE